MIAEILSTLSLVAYIIAGLSFALAVIFWFAFRIPSVVGDLSGRTAKKSIEKRRRANARSGQKAYRPSPENAARGKVTETAKPEQPVKAPRQPEAPAPANYGTTIHAQNRATAYEGQETELLQGGDETALLVDENETTALNEEPGAIRDPGGKKMTMLNEVMFIHTDEVISW